MAKTARRRRWLWLGVLPALVLLAVFAVRALLEPERLSAYLLREASSATGLQLALSAPAEVGLWPDLHLELTGLVATAPTASTPLLRIERAEVVLPWSALDSEALQIRSLRLVKPELDWERLQAWLATRSRSGAPMVLPRIDAAVEVSEGRVDGGAWRVENLALLLPALRAGEATTLTISGIFAAARAETLELPNPARGEPVEPHSIPSHAFAASLSTTPRQLPTGIRLDDFTLTLTAPIALTVSGHVDLATDAPRASLATTFPTWPATWPALPLLPSDAPVQLTVDYDTSLTARLTRADDAIDLVLTPGNLIEWLANPTTTLPASTGTARAERLQFGALELRGVELRIDEPDDDAQP